EARARWEAETLRPALGRAPERARFETSWGSPVPRLTTPADLAGLDYLRDLGFPGEYPYTRGVQPTMYRGRLWTMRQYAGFGTAADVAAARGFGPGPRAHPPLPLSPRPGPDRVVGRLRPADPDGPRRRRAGGPERSRPGRRLHLERGRHGRSLRRHPPRSRLDL